MTHSAHGAPRKGDRITYRGRETGTVLSVEGNLCWMTFDDGSERAPFIWRFKDRLNELHSWPGKSDQYGSCGFGCTSKAHNFRCTVHGAVRVRA